MTTRQFFPVLLAALLVSAGIALLFSGVARAETTTTTTTDTTVETRGTPNDTTAAKLDKLDTRRATIEAQRARALEGLAVDDPRRAEINAIYDAKLAQVDRKQAHFEKQGEHLASVPGASHREARGDNRFDRPDHLDRSQRPDSAGRPDGGRHGARG
jgi:uncharacterized protein YhaN